MGKIKLSFWLRCVHAVTFQIPFVICNFALETRQMADYVNNHLKLLPAPAPTPKPKLLYEDFSLKRFFFQIFCCNKYVNTLKYKALKQ